jgi:hypothetical protein
MASVVKIKRTSISGRYPNTSILDTGELALNLADGKLFSSNGSVVFEIGANTSTLTVNNYSFPTTDGTSGQLLRTNGAGQLEFVTVAGASTPTLEEVIASGNTTTLSVTVGGLTVNGYSFPSGDGTAGQVLQTDGNGQLVFGTVSAGGGVGGATPFSMYYYTSTTDQTTFSGVDDEGNTLEYDEGQVKVFYNGVLMRDGVDYVANTGSSVVFTEPTVADKDIIIESYGYVESIQVGSNYVLAATEALTSGTSQIVLDSFDENTHKSAQYLVEASDTTGVHMTTVNLIHHANTVYLTEYGTVQSGNSMISLDADIASGNIRLLCTPSASGITINVKRSSFR